MLIYDIVPPEKLKEFTKEKILGIRFYETKNRKLFAFSWRAILFFFIVLYFISGLTPFTILQKSIRAISQEEKNINFYANLCTGNWQNPQNTRDQPEVGPTEDINSFSEENSAIYKVGPLNLICQNFIAGGKKIEIDGEQGTTTETSTTSTTIIEATTSDASSTEEEQATTTVSTITNLELPISFFEKTKKFFSLSRTQAQEKNIISAKIKLSFAIGEQQVTSNGQRVTSTEQEIKGTSSEEVIMFWSKVKNFLGTLVARAEEGEQQATSSEEMATSSEEMIESEPPINEATTTEDTITKATTTEATSTATTKIATTTDVATTDTTSEPLTGVNSKIIIWYSLDGENWQKLDAISSPLLSNALNGGYFEHEAPFLKNLEDIENLKIKFEGVIEEETNIIFYLDSVWVEIIYGEQEETKKSAKEKPEIILLSSKKDFKGDEEPEFQFRYKKNGNDLLTQLIGVFSNTNYWEDVSTTLQITDSGGETIEISSFLFLENNGEFLVKLKKSSEFKPGLYKIVLIIENAGDIQEFEQDFSWGVLAINTNKSIFLPGETAYLQMAVLDDQGWMVCNAYLTLEITSPTGKKTILKTSNRTIIINPECKVHGITEKPDYEANYVADEVGEYLMTLTAVTQEGTRSIIDSFEVRNNVPFDVERQGPTRILPTEPYTMKFIIKVNQDFNGIVREMVPESFEIQKTELFLIDTGIQPGATSQEFDDASGVELSIEPFRIINQEDKRTINWTVQWQRNQIYELSYQFDAPDISPYFYLLGPFEITGSFQETRNWQIASDASGDIILFWDAATDAPAGWDCISCDVADTYYQKFPRATSTPGGTGGTTTHTHTMNLENCAAATGFGYFSGAAINFPTDGHTHPSVGGETISSEYASPPYYELKMIATTSPSTIPSGAIAMFGTTSLPANWTLYSAADGYIIRGGPNASTTGAAHTHSNVGFTLAANTSQELVASGSKDGEQVGHTHVYSGGTSDGAEQLPPFIDVVLAQATADVAISNGMIAMFDTTPLPANWTEVSAVNNDRFIRASSTSYGGTGGSLTHSHPNKIFTAPATADFTAKDVDLTPAQNGSDVGHIHDTTISFSSEANIPPYVDIVFAEYTAVANDPPQVDSVSLNTSSNIILFPNSTTSVSATTSVSDAQGCATISTTTAVIYREGVGSGCSADDNNCYTVGSCIQDECVGNNATYTCTIAMEFFAEPTDEGNYAQSQGWDTEEWIALITVYDNQDDSATGSNEAVEEVDVQTLLAFELSATTIDYGKVKPNGTSTEQTTTVNTIGNVPLDVNASGTDMTWSSNNIAVSQQHWSTTTGFIWDDGTPLEATSTLVELESGKPTQSPTNATDDVYWKLKVPLDKQAGGPYQGQAIFIEVQD
jgi:hypothetical protein